MRLPRVTKARSSAVVGLDIGTGAVQAVEVSRSRRGLALRRWGLVELPVGAVVDGSIVEPGQVVAALRQLWSNAGFSTRNVVVAVSGQRVLVRHASVALMSAGDFRLALQFQASELIPIPADEAIIDFVIVPAGVDEHPPNEMSILLAAAERTLIDSVMSLLRDASLTAVALDPASTAAVRASRWAGLGSSEPVAIVDIGAELTVITVREGGLARFSRTLDSGGANITSQMAQRLGITLEDAERLKRQTATTDGLPRLEASDTERLVMEIEGSLSFFASQMAEGALGRILVTGGPARSPVLLDQLTRRLPGPVEVLDALAGLDLSGSSLSDEERELATTGALLAVGAAEWDIDQPGERLSLLPPEIAEAAARRRKLARLGVAAAVLLVGLGALSVQRTHEVTKQKALVVIAQEQSLGLQTEVSRLAPLTAAQATIQARVAVAKAAAAGDIDWPRLLAEIATAMPAGTQMTTCSFAAGGLTAAALSAPVAGAAPRPSTIGTVNMGVTGRGGEEVVAAWLRAMATVKGLAGVLVPSASVTAGTVTFTATATVTPAAPMVHRSASSGGAQS